MLNSPVLVLNKFFFPVDTTSVKRAFLMLYIGAAKAVDIDYETFDFDSWSEISILKKSESIRTVSKIIKIPRVIIVLRYDKVPNKEVKFNRYNIFRRDRSECQYCRKPFPKNQLTIDHVHPKSLGGKTIWENVVCCCITCNRKKGSNILSSTNMKLAVKPNKPSWELLSNLYLQTIKFDEWKPFLSSVETSYWNVELEE
ncbi:MAG: HNH endonuclease [Thermodesulfobacteriota bacteirum]|jgi:5-methylcytosine-specific restriction endonuclease McrA|nr:HNH endonuclease [Thermodesulfobacteriota bacterium]